MSGFDLDTNRSHRDILDRQSRPQRQSTWIPKQGDWRYSTDAFQYDGFDGSPRNRTTWDELDYDHHISRRSGGSDSYAASSCFVAEDDEYVLEEAAMPERRAPSSSSRFLNPDAEKLAASATYPIQLERTRYKIRSPASSNRFSGMDAPTSARRHLASESVTAKGRTGRRTRPEKEVEDQCDDDISLGASPSNDDAMKTASNLLPPIESFSGKTWQDETHNFDIRLICAAIRAPDEKRPKLVKTYSWYPSAVPIDALFPPGVPISAKEICAYYPHHVRWQDIMLRLIHNDYRGSDILGIQAAFRGAPQHHMDPAVMNQIQRDNARHVLPDFKTTGYQGKGDANQYTDHLKPGAYLEKRLKGYITPTFDQLLRGLKHLPDGQDARGLTHCLFWYHNICNTFTPKLELNVLHTQALIRALRQPVSTIGSRNLDRLVLDDWRHQKHVEKVSITNMKTRIQKQNSKQSAKTCSRSQAMLDIHKDPIDLKVRVKIPIRHILTFPFLALHGIVSEALQLGIDNAEERKSAMKNYMMPPRHAKVVRATPTDTVHRTPKRPRSIEVDNELGLMTTPKRQCKSNDRVESLIERTPKRPTVSPITPRTLTYSASSTQPTKTPLKMESSPLKRYCVQASLM
ncbi:hypothetical protein EKO04_008631 [Ascochyta lentis]|uniref:Uncharacterized protein n=1 Tax=Ascochyta lentis TaxID=205686 RepID=A0A8H7J0X6_9PLEO|nr:hypothetical protein EKO04_008631 [Ascochyta lentis]